MTTTHRTAPRPRPADTRGGRVVAALVDHGLLGPDRAAEAGAVVEAVLAAPEGEAPPLRRRLSELAGYLGGALVVAAAALFVADQWATLTVAARVGILAGAAVLLLAAGTALALVRGGRTALPADPVRRRLAGLLLTAGAATAAGAVMVWLIDVVERRDTELTEGPLIGLGASLTLALVAIVGYRVAPTLLGQGAVAFGLAYAVPFAHDSAGEIRLVPLGLSYLAVGLVWLALAEGGGWHEKLPARVVGAAFVLIGAQVPATSDSPWVGYLVTALVATAAFGGYVVRRAWPYLAVGVLGVTLAVPEALLDWTEGSLGTAGVLLAAGVTLLGASLLGLRLHREVEET